MADGRLNNGRHCRTGIITTAQKDTRVRHPNGEVYSCDTHRSEEENTAFVARVEELHKTELYVPGVHLTGSAEAKDGTCGLSQLSMLIEQSHKKQKAPTPGRRKGHKWGKKEGTGTWTEQEHVLFVEGMKQWPKKWKKVAALVKTRSAPQCQSHGRSGNCSTS
jgi:hypothetical protein